MEACYSKSEAAGETSVHGFPQTRPAASEIQQFPGSEKVNEDLKNVLQGPMNENPRFCGKLGAGGMLNSIPRRRPETTHLYLAPHVSFWMHLNGKVPNNFIVSHLVPRLSQPGNKECCGTSPTPGHRRQLENGKNPLLLVAQDPHMDLCFWSRFECVRMVA